MAIANEDPEMVNFLINNGVSTHERAFGALFSPIDQRKSRRDVPNDEIIQVDTKTDYKGKGPRQIFIFLVRHQPLHLVMYILSFSSTL